MATQKKIRKIRSINTHLREKNYVLVLELLEKMPSVIW